MTPLEALQRMLAGEHAAVYVYGVLGGRISESAEPELSSLLISAYEVHRRRRDELNAMVRAQKGDPVAADPSYRLPTPSRTTDQLRAAARITEERSAAVYADAVGSTSRGDRKWAIDALRDAAVRQLSFGGKAETFPGLQEM
jgi:Domain of unknown function (DUF4439)